VPLIGVTRSSKVRPAVARRTATLVVFAAFMLALLASSPALRATEARHKEVWAGADAASNVWLVYSGTTLAPFGDIHEDGLRLRFVGAYGHYRYESTTDTLDLTEYTTRVSSGDALIGYLWRLDPLILKAFVGAAFSDHQIRPIDRNNQVQGPELGIKLVAELWYNLGDYGFASLDIAWSQAHETRSARARIGYRVSPHVSVGPEAGLNLDRQADFKIYQESLDYRSEPIDYGRIGAFARYEWYGGEVSAAAGVIGDFRNEKSAYGTLNWIKQF
jgi:Cellulose biosynthesis protein BcsS